MSLWLLSIILMITLAYICHANRLPASQSPITASNQAFKRRAAVRHSSLSLVKFLYRIDCGSREYSRSVFLFGRIPSPEALEYTLRYSKASGLGSLPSRLPDGRPCRAGFLRQPPYRQLARAGFVPQPPRVCSNFHD